MKLVLLSCICLFLTSFHHHKFYVSVTDVAYIEKEKNLQVISRVFADDLEEVLSTRYDSKVVLLPTKESKNADELLQKYIEQKIKITANNKSISLQYLGKRYEDDRVYMYLEAIGIQNFEKVSIENLVLTDLFEEQKNLVHFKKNNQTKSVVLSKEYAKHTFSF